MATYYVSVHGDDGRTGTSREDAFRTIQRGADAAMPGDSVLIAGGIYRETVMLPRSGTPYAPITFAAIPGEEVIVSGLEVLTAPWQPFRNGIWQADCALPMGDQDAVFVDGQMMWYARWPKRTDDDLFNHQGAPLRHEDCGIDFIHDPDLPDHSDGCYDGAVLWCSAYAKWTAWGATVRQSGGGTLRFTIPGEMAFAHDPGKPSGGNHSHHSDLNYYYLSGKLCLLDAPREWFYSAEEKKLYLYPPAGTDPLAMRVEYRARELAFDLGVNSWLRLHNLCVEGAALSIRGDHNLVQGMRARHLVTHNGRGMHHTLPIKHNGIHITGSHNRVCNGEFAWSAGNAFLIDGGEDNALINNLIHHIDYLGSYDCAIRLETTRPVRDNRFTRVVGNTIHTLGRSALHIGRPAQVLYNRISRAMLMTDDGGAVYACDVDMEGSHIAYNVVHSVRSHHSDRLSSAYYLDNDAINCVLHHNVAYDIEQDGAYRFNGPVNTGRYLLHATTFHTPDVLMAGTMGGYPEAINCLHNAGAENFEDAAAGDFRLKADSPARGAGQAVDLQTMRPLDQPADLGAFAFGSAWAAGCSVRGRTEDRP